MTEQKHTNDPLNVDEALSTSEAFLIKNKNVLLGSSSCSGSYRRRFPRIQTFHF
mgnify:CR=1 FL=1